MSLFSKLFGGKASKQVEPELHEGFRIFVEPIKEGGSYRIAARIEKEVAGAVKTHHLVRADTSSSLDEARDMSLRKARMLIDEQGESILR